ncbi:MAG: branched-chain amino acid ABC transporter permease [Cyanobacteriota bacterium]|nr:branched-chain amino acid ABC transporter permease [Cyanobacteriota bacterium]
MQFLINTLASSAVNLMAGMAVSLLYLPTGCFPLSLGFTALVGAYAAWALQPQVGLPLAVAAAVMASALMGLMIELALLGPIRRQSKNPSMTLIASLAVLTIGIHILSIIFGDDVKSFAGPSNFPIQIGTAAYLTLPQLAMLINASLVSFSMFVVLKYTASGRKLLAVSYQPLLARIYGLRPERIRSFSVMAGSSIAGLAASLVAWDTGLEPGLGFSIVVAGAVTMIVSGIGEPAWLLGGAVLIAFLNNLAAVLLGGKWIHAVSFIVMILFLLVRPLGMSGRRLRKIAI